jgi:HORMA domain
MSEQLTLKALAGVHDMELTPAESLALVKIFLNASMACIFHTRELLNWSSNCFRTRFVDDITLRQKSDRIYPTFCHNDSESTKLSQEVRVLVRSDNKSANSILEMLVSC